MDIAELYENTDLTIQGIADKLNSTYKIVSSFIMKNYTVSYRQARKRRSYRLSKLGEKNPSFSLKGEEARKYKGLVSDTKGYLMRIKPDWYTGRKGSKHVFEHQLVWCEANGYTELPRGFVIHHCDQNPHNNVIDNLICVSMADHARIHTWLKSVTTISKESTAKWLEAHGRDWYL